MHVSLPIFTGPCLCLGNGGPRIHTYRLDDDKEPCFDLDECTVYKSSLQSMPRFTIYSTLKGHSQNAVHSSLTVTPILYQFLLKLFPSLIEKVDTLGLETYPTLLAKFNLSVFR